MRLPPSDPKTAGFSLRRPHLVTIIINYAERAQITAFGIVGEIEEHRRMARKGIDRTSFAKFGQLKFGVCVG